MAAQTPIDRQSLNTDLASRYETQRVGGAFNAKEVKEQPIDFGYQDKQFESPPTFLSDNFNEKALNYSDYLGVSRQRYKS